MNRLQGALLREAYCLLRDGVLDAEDLDRVVRDSIGRRWALMGPWLSSGRLLSPGRAERASLI